MYPDKKKKFQTLKIFFFLSYMIPLVSSNDNSTNSYLQPIIKTYFFLLNSASFTFFFEPTILH